MSILCYVNMAQLQCGCILDLNLYGSVIFENKLFDFTFPFIVNSPPPAHIFIEKVSYCFTLFYIPKQASHKYKSQKKIVKWKNRELK